MTFRTLIRRSLRFHWRAHLGVVLGAAVGSAALIGALVVGDSIKESLKRRALDRLGGACVAINSGDRFFTEQMIERMFASTSNQAFLASTGWTNGKPLWDSSEGRVLLALPTSVSRQDGTARANRVQLLGVSTFDSIEWHSEAPVVAGGTRPGHVWLNEALARQLSARIGDELVMRIQKPSALSPEAAIHNRNDSTTVMRLRVAGFAPFWLEIFTLDNGATPPLNAFVERFELAGAVGLQGRANLFLAGSAITWRKAGVGDRFRTAYRLWQHSRQSVVWEMATSGSSVTGWPASDAQTVEVLKPILAQAFTLSDAQLELAISQPAPLPPNYKLFDQVIELRTPRIFLDPPVARAATGADTNAQPLVTYLANLLSAGTNRTPYSMVTAAGAPWTPLDMRDDEIVANEWLAQDLQVKPGDEISLVYFDPESGARLVERTNTFRLRSVVPLDPPWTDRTLMPQFPGIEKAESTRDWDAGFPLVHKIRSKDEDYWKQYRGTPKAFVTLAAGKKMWANRFGELTAIRFPVPTNVVGTRSTASQASPQNGDAVERVPTSPEEYRAALEKKILASLKPEEVGLRFEPVREQALKAAEQSQPFGQLFLGFSFFLIVAALLLMALLFQLGLEQRAPEVGTLLALGFSPKQVRKLLLLEGGALAFIGGLLGALAGIAYARAMLRGLVTIWRDAVGATTLSFHMTAETLAIGVLASVIVSVLTIWMTMRKFVRRPARELLAGEVQSPTAKAQSRGAIIAGAALVAALVVLGWILSKGETANAGAFFGAGALLLIAGIAVVSASLTKWMRQSKARSASPRKAAGLTLTALGVRGCARRRKRSLATVAMLACGSFLILAIGVFRLDANRDAWKRNSGTGGFALVGETTMPVVHDLNAKSGREYFGLSEADLAGVSFVPMRVREGDEASCLNLNRAQRPRLLGVKPEMLEGRFTFSKGAGWNSLRSSRRKEAQTSKAESNQGLLTSAATSQNEIAAIGDANSIQWALGKKVGDTLDYVDERSQPFKVRIVGAVANSILQGSLIIDEGEFVKRFPSESGYRMFLIDAPSNSVSQISATLSRAFQDVGLELTLAAQRLDQFNAVQNTYLGTFQILGGLGLLLGSAGLGVVVMRNALERRGELALLLATGFRRPTLQWLVLSEHAALLGLGIAVGIISAAVAVLPALLSRAAQLPYLSLSLTVVAVLLNGALWTWVATRLALRGDLLKALRNE